MKLAWHSPAKQSSQFAPVTLRKLALDVTLFVNQATLNDTVGKVLFHSSPQRVATIEHDEQSMLTLKSPRSDSSKQFPGRFEVFAAAKGEIQNMLLATSIDPNGHDGNLVFAQVDAKNYARPLMVSTVGAIKYLQRAMPSVVFILR